MNKCLQKNDEAMLIVRSGPWDMSYRGNFESHPVLNSNRNTRMSAFDYSRYCGIVEYSIDWKRKYVGNGRHNILDLSKNKREAQVTNGAAAP